MGIQYELKSDDGSTLTYIVHLPDGDVEVVVAKREGLDPDTQLHREIRGLVE